MYTTKLKSYALHSPLTPTHDLACECLRRVAPLILIVQLFTLYNQLNAIFNQGFENTFK